MSARFALRSARTLIAIAACGALSACEQAPPGGSAAPLAAASAAQPAQPVAVAFAPPPPALGEALAVRGRDAIPACVTCHGPGGRGLGGALSAAFPPIAGQPAVYLERQLRAWKNGQRPAGLDGLMGAIGKRLSEAEIVAVSQYFAAQPTLVATVTTEARP